MRPDPIARRKDELRALCRARRQSLSRDRHAVLDRHINRILVREIMAREAGCVAGYLAFDGEPDLLPALQELEHNGVGLALPATGTGGGGAMRLLRWRPGAPTQASRFGIQEPAGGAEAPLHEVDIVLLPLVAYDAQGARLGMGSACYDRLLNPCRDHGQPLRVGVAYADQEVAHVPRNDWDVPLHALVNEHGWFSFPGANRDNGP